MLVKNLVKRINSNLKYHNIIFYLNGFKFHKYNIAHFAKKKEGGSSDNKKVKTEKEKQVINKEYENISTDEIKEKYKQIVEQTISKLKDDISTIKLSRSNPKILENCQVTIKSKKYKLSELGTVMVRGANILVISPFDEDHKEAIVKSVESSKLDVQINIEGSAIVVTLGAIPNDIKTDNIQNLKKMTDNAKDKLKNARQACNNEMKKLEKILGKDEGRRLETSVLDNIDKYDL